jgi:adenylate kinase family enzyme
MRIAVVGTSGSGKSTFASRLAGMLGVPFIELDLINWRPGWTDRSETDPLGFKADVQAAVDQEAWTSAGNYSLARPLVWARATHVVWLDLPRPVIMRQVIWRSLQRAASGKDVFPGCREDWTRMAKADHPIRWAWDTYARRKTSYGAKMADPAYSHIKVIRCQSRAEADEALKRLGGATG